MAKLRGTCSECRRFGSVRQDGFMWSHRCGGVDYKSPPAVDVQTFERRVEQFVDAMLPKEATADQRAAAIKQVSADFGGSE